MALPPPVNPPPVNPPEPAQIYATPLPNSSDISMLPITDAERASLSGEPDGTVIYNSDEDRLQVKIGPRWTNVALPFPVLGSGLDAFVKAVSRALSTLSRVQKDVSALKREGIPRWSSSTAYRSNARVVGSDGKVYRLIGSSGYLQDPVTETEPRTVWVEDVQKIHYTGRVIAGGRINAAGTLATAESWNIASATRSGSNPDTYIYTVILDAADLEEELGVDDFSDRDYRVQVHPLVDVNDVTIIPIIPSDPPCFTVQFEKRVSQSVLHEGIARSFYFTVYAK